MRARNLKPGFFKNELLGSADPLIGLLFEGLWCMADREGRLEDRPLRMCAEVFPYRRAVSEKKVSGFLDWLQAHNFIVRYESAGTRFIQVLEFLRHQHPHKSEAPSRIQPLESIPTGAYTGDNPDANGMKTEVARLNPSSLNPESGYLNPDTRAPRLRAAGEVNGSGRATGDEFAQVKAAYPAGTYRQANWLKAEHEALNRVEEGASWQELLGGVQRYHAQCDAKGSTGTQFVLSPEKFFDPKARPWLEPFPLPVRASSYTPPKSVEQLEAEERTHATG